MSEAEDRRVVSADCVAWSTKGSGKPDGGGSSKPVAIAKDTVVVVQGVSVEVEPRSLLVRGTIDGTERVVEIRERFLTKAPA